MDDFEAWECTTYDDMRDIVVELLSKGYVIVTVKKVKGKLLITGYLDSE